MEAQALPLLLPPMPPMLQSPLLCCHCNALAEAALSQETTANADVAVPTLLQLPSLLLIRSCCCVCSRSAVAVADDDKKLLLNMHAALSL